MARRIQRRMQVLQIDNPANYFEHLRRAPMELDALFRELLINVTGFFRDPEAFAALKPVVNDIVAGKDADDQIRVWVPACATGEEAYSIAILLAEAMPLEERGRRSRFSPRTSTSTRSRRRVRRTTANRCWPT